MAWILGLIADIKFKCVSSLKVKFFILMQKVGVKFMYKGSIFLGFVTLTLLLSLLEGNHFFYNKRQ